ncbi:MAG TPA: thioredoxin-like domain-containing protein [Pirellulales bacterium]|nr:thioredoxin-like domain-containing protein [Pirellulales bacterium]
MLPHERSLVKRLADKPFALIGVNGDQANDELQKKNEEQQITWRSFKNDRGDNKAIAEEWNVQGWPTLYLIDHKGVIRRKWLGSPGDETLDKEIDTLVAAAEKDSGQKND